MELLNSGTDRVLSSVSYDMMRAWHVENLTLTGSGGLGATGNWLNNQITGNSGNNLLDGNRGNDTLDGGAGSDTLIGGLGDDTLIYDAADTGLQGGAGADTLRINGAAVVLDLTVLADSLMTDVEIIDLAGTGNNTLKLGLADVLALSSTTDVLRVDGNAGDVVNLAAGSAWTAGSDQVIGVNSYRSYTQGLATLLVDADMSTVLLA